MTDDLRADGWMVAVHNDYMLHGEFHTFWLLTHSTSGRFLKGEGRTDADALNQIRLQMVTESEQEVQPSVIKSAITFARDAFYNDGAEGETVHLLCDTVEALQDEVDALRAKVTE